VRFLAIAFAVPALAVGLGFSSPAFSQGRTVEDTLVVSDPTVAARGKWAVGGAVEYWKVNASWDVTQPVDGTAKLDFSQTGFNVFAGYGNWTLQATSRSGSGDYSVEGTAACCGHVKAEGPQDVKDAEFTLRYLFPTRSVSPYILVGYTSTNIEATERITVAQIPAVWTCTGTTTLQSKTDYTGPLIGGGAVVPFSRYLGMRADLRLKYYSGKYDVTNKNAAGARRTDDLCHGESTGIGYDFTLTGYWNIIAGLNAQLGFKSQWLNAGESVPDWYKFGIFGMLGYTVRF